VPRPTTGFKHDTLFRFVLLAPGLYFLFSNVRLFTFKVNNYGPLCVCFFFAIRPFHKGIAPEKTRTGRPRRPPSIVFRTRHLRTPVWSKQIGSIVSDVRTITIERRSTRVKKYFFLISTVSPRNSCRTNFIVNVLRELPLFRFFRMISFRFSLYRLLVYYFFKIKTRNFLLIPIRTPR